MCINMSECYSSIQKIFSLSLVLVLSLFLLSLQVYSMLLTISQGKKHVEAVRELAMKQDTSR